MSTHKIRRTNGRYEWDQVHQLVASAFLLDHFSTKDDPAIGNGGSAGRLRTTAEVEFHISDRRYTKAAADDLWNLSGEDPTDEAGYRAYWLLVDAAGAGSIAAGRDAPTEEDALSLLPPLDGTKSVLGVFVAGPETDFTAALEAQGTVYNGIPEGVPLKGLAGRRYVKPGVIEFGGF